MSKRELLEDYRRPEDKIKLAEILDKLELAEKTHQMQITDFLDMYQISLAKSFLKKAQITNYEMKGGVEEAERKVVLAIPEENEEDQNTKIEEKLKAIRITLPPEEIGNYSHRNYLGGIVKLGMKREKVGDILVRDEGADIIVKAETAQVLKQELGTLTRFQKAQIEVIELAEIKKPEIKTEELSIIVPSLRLDNIVSDLARTSRSKAVQIIGQERVFINGQNETKVAKTVKIGDVITIRGKGRFVVKGVTGTTRSGRSVLLIEKFS